MAYADEHLTTVPTFVLWQDDTESSEQPIIVKFYNGTISLEQGNQAISLDPASFTALSRAIKKFLPEAMIALNK